MQYTMMEALPKIKKILSEDKLSIFAGSGISVDSGLPTWDGFIKKYIDICEELNFSLDDNNKFSDIITDAKENIENNGNPISIVTALKDKIKELKNNGINTDFCDNELNAWFYSAVPCEYHKYIVATNYKYIITTNYDCLLEEAAKL